MKWKSINAIVLVSLFSASAAEVGDDQCLADGRKLPILVLGNRSDHCDTILPEGAETDQPTWPEPPPCADCPPYLVPPMYLPNSRRRPAPAIPAPTPTLADEPPSETSPPVAPPLPSPDEPAQFAPPAEPGSVFSEDGDPPLGKLGELLGKFQKKLQDVKAPALTDVEPAAEDPPSAEPTPEPPQLEQTPTEPLLPEPAAPATLPVAEALPQEEEQPPVPLEPQELPPVQSPERSKPVSVGTPDSDPISTDFTQGLKNDSLSWIHQTAVDTPVDRLALADNLYAAGEVTLAMDVYTQIDLATLEDVDRHWVEFQLAGCHRQIGNIEESAKYYRKVVALEHPPWMVEMARWWLMVLDKRKSMGRYQNELDTTINLLQEQVRDDAKP